MQLLKFLVLLSVVVSCQTIDTDKVLFVGDYEDLSIINAKSERIRCEQPEFNQMVCTDIETYTKLLQYVACLERRKTKSQCRKHLRQ
jgi:hypothetical protein